VVAAFGAVHAFFLNVILLLFWLPVAQLLAAAATQDVDKCFVPTEFCRQLGLGMGLAASQLVLYGLPIRPIFSKRLPGRNTLRKKLVRGHTHGLTF
jgi:hypothetical protein